ncbi:hypothetical protein OAQ98_04275 [Alphaproteobacteria bacterium]|nr:hypothetical protein [Alphaproteobacteria bacterium]
MDLNINDVFQKLDIKSSDTIVIHGDAGIAFQLKEIDIENRLRYFLQKLIDLIDIANILDIYALNLLPIVKKLLKHKLIKIVD